MKVLPVSRRYSPSGTKSRRQLSRTFYVKKDSVSVRVCKKAFLSMHGVKKLLMEHFTMTRKEDTSQETKPS